jgi:hypothetical protein
MPTDRRGKGPNPGAADRWALALELLTGGHVERPGPKGKKHKPLGAWPPSRSRVHAKPASGGRGAK